MVLLLLISLCVSGIVFCIGLIILTIQRNKKMLTSSINEDAEKDFLEKISEKRKNKLKERPWGLSYRSYTLIASGGALFLGILCYLVFQNILIVIIGIAAGLYLPELVMLIQNNKRKALFEERFARSLRQLSSSLKAGRSIQQSIEDICNSEFIHESIKEEYKQLNSDLQLGISVSDAFERFSNRVNCQDVRDVSIAISMQMQVGGREAQVIESIAKSIGSRVLTRKETKSMFAGANMTVLVMDIFPFVIVAFLSCIGGYLEPIWSNSFCVVLFIAALVIMGVGSVVTHQMIAKMKKGCGL